MIKQIVAVLLGLGILLPYSVFAQDKQFTAEEREWIAFVGAALDNLKVQSSYSLDYMETSQHTDSREDSIPILDSSIITQAQVAQDETGNLMAVLVSTNLTSTANITSSEMLTATQHVDVIFLKNTYYIRMDAKLNGEEWLISGIQPSTWYAFPSNDLPSMLQSLPEVATLWYIAGTSGNWASNVLSVNEESVLQLLEDDQVILDGKDMRVFDMQMNLENSLPPEYAQAYAQMVDSLQQAFGDDSDSELPNWETALNILSNSVTVHQTIWIGKEDNLPYKVSRSVHIDLGTFFTQFNAEESSGSSGTQENTATTRYFDFNVPFEVDAPVDAFPILNESKD